MNLLDATLAAGVEIANVAAWCREHGVAPRTFYRHRDRVQAEGQWRERSRRPRTSPGEAPAELVAWIVKLRADLVPDNGADYIRDHLVDVAARTNSHWSVPARSTINRVLDRQGLLESNPAKKPRSSWRRFSFARPRDCYQIDATTVHLADARMVAVVEVLDDCTRLLVASHAAPAETTQAAIAAITQAVTDYGAPGIVLCDNGVAFTSRQSHPSGVRPSFPRHLGELGIRVVHSSPYHPQTCGKVERHHQTFKNWLAAQPHPPATLRQLQRLLDRYRDYYNTRRRHSALPHRATPQQAWTSTPDHGGPQHLPIQTDATVHHCRVYLNGEINVGTHIIGVGRARARTTLTAIRDHDHVTVYNPDGQPIGHAQLTAGTRYVRLTPTP
jgi:transposase InsO family protein